MRTSVRSISIVLFGCLFLLPHVARAESYNSTVFDLLKNGYAKQEFLNISDAGKYFPCAKIFITSISCEGGAKVYSDDGGPYMPESLGARVWFDGQVVATLPLARTGSVSWEDRQYTGFVGMQSFANPIFLDTTASKCNNKTSSKGKLSVDSPDLNHTHNPTIMCYVSYYRL
jgi:hypothetical protein